MATLQELSALPTDPLWGALVNKIKAALLIKAHAITELTEPSPTAEQLAYALSVLQNPGAKANEVIFYVVAANESASPTDIIGASDLQINNNVSSAVDKLFGL